MTREEAIQRLKTTDACDSELCEALDMAIKALEQMPCGDCISREYVIKLLENTKRTRKEITNRIYEVQSVSPQSKMGSSSENQNKWIPVETALPEVGSQVLVCYEFKKKRYVYIADFYGDGKFHRLDDEYLTTEGRKYRKAVAWMPLPQPYQSEIPTGQTEANGELYPGEFDDPLAAEGSDKECTKNI